MIRIFHYRRSLLLTTVATVFLAAGAEAGGFVYKPARRGSDKLHLTTDFAAYLRISGDTRASKVFIYGNDPRLMLSLDLGLYQNINLNSGLGGGIFIASTNESYRYGLRPRYRRWIGKHGRLDFSPGLVLGGKFDESDIVFPGFSGAVSFSPVTWVSLVTAVEVIQHEFTGNTANFQRGEKWTSTSLYGGIRMESYAGAIGVALTIVAAAVFVIVVISTWSD